MPTQDPRRAAVWSRYWAGGVAHACPGSLDERLDGALGAFWGGVGASLGPAQRVLEIGAGNGAVTRLLVEARGADTPAIDAVDLAQVRPAWLGQLPPKLASRVHFHGGMAAEQLPFPDGCFDLAVAQFALEYMDTAAVLPELRRCLRPGGRAGFLMHHRDSILVRVAGDERRHLAGIVAPGGLLDTAAALVPDLVRARTPEGVRQLQADADAEARRRRYNELQAGLESAGRASATPDLLDEAAATTAALLQLAAREGEAPAMRQLQAQRQAYQDAMVRLDELLACALDEAGMQRLVAALAAQDFEGAATGTLEDGGRLMGWTLVASRGA